MKNLHSKIKALANENGVWKEGRELERLKKGKCVRIRD